MLLCLRKRSEIGVLVALATRHGGATSMRILICEDDPRLGASLKQGLEESHYAVDLATDGQSALALGKDVDYDLIVLDIRLPELSGFDVCRALRSLGRTMPIIFLTALGNVEQRVTGLDSGADDYLVKPFAFVELQARIRALLRREGGTRSAELRFQDITLNPSTHEVWRGARPIDLSSKEYALLEFMMRHPRQVLSRQVIADHVWDMDADHLSNVIDVYISYLRRKLSAEGEGDVLISVRGYGYQLKEATP
jgi:DNA-binding response OmpR family regulator